VFNYHWCTVRTWREKLSEFTSVLVLLLLKCSCIVSSEICYVMLCYVMSCYVMSCYVTLCYVMLRYVMSYEKNGWCWETLSLNCFIILYFYIAWYLEVCRVSQLSVWTFYYPIHQNVFAVLLPLTYQVFEMSTSHLRVLLTTKCNKMTYFMCYLKWKGSAGNFNTFTCSGVLLYFFNCSGVLQSTLQVNVCVKSGDRAGYCVIALFPLRLPGRWEKNLLL